MKYIALLCNMKVQKSMRLDERVVELIEFLAIEENRSFSQMCEIILKERADEHDRELHSRDLDNAARM